MHYDVKIQRIHSFSCIAELYELFKEYRIEGATRQKGINRLHGNMDYKEIIINYRVINRLLIDAKIVIIKKSHLICAIIDNKKMLMIYI